MKRIKEFFKGNSTIVKIYEDIGMLRYYIVASKNARKAQKLISKHEIDHIKKFKNIHDGERCFIVGSGPSLKLEDLEASSEDNQCNVWLLHKNVLPQSEYLAVCSGICRKTLGSLGHSHDACFDPSSDVLRRCR